MERTQTKHGSDLHAAKGTLHPQSFSALVLLGGRNTRRAVHCLQGPETLLALGGRGPLGLRTQCPRRTEGTGMIRVLLGPQEHTSVPLGICKAFHLRGK